MLFRSGVPSIDAMWTSSTTTTKTSLPAVDTSGIKMPKVKRPKKKPTPPKPRTVSESEEPKKPVHKPMRIVEGH